MAETYTGQGGHPRATLTHSTFGECCREVSERLTSRIQQCVRRPPLWPVVSDCSQKVDRRHESRLTKEDGQMADNPVGRGLTVHAAGELQSKPQRGITTHLSDRRTLKNTMTLMPALTCDAVTDNS